MLGEEVFPLAADQESGGPGTEAPPELPAPARRRRWGGQGEGAEVLQTLVVALVLALLVRWLVMEGFVVSGLSMVPNLHDRDRLLVNKIVYHLHTPQRGDIVVFAYPRDTTRDFVKRVIGRPGDTVEVRGGRVYINGAQLDEPYIKDFGGPDQPSLVVPPDTIWVLGDNRPYSDDSRIFGPVSLKLLSGKVFFRYWPLPAARAFS